MSKYIQLSALFLSLVACQDNAYHIDVIVPIQHEALDALVKGFTEHMPATIQGKPCRIHVHNAHGDTHTQRALLQRKASHLIVPLSTTTTKMAFSLLPEDQLILGLASLPLPECSRNHVILNDETPLSLQQAFLEALGYPRYTLLHSLNEKVFANAKSLAEMSSRIQPTMVQSLADIHATLAAIQGDAVFLLKDSLLASGIQSILHHCSKPVITCDEATVRQGAACALGVREYDIGEKGAAMALQLLEGQEVPSQSMDQFVIFANPEACQRFPSDIQAIARSLSLEVS